MLLIELSFIAHINICKELKTKLNVKEIIFCITLWLWMSLGCSILIKELHTRALTGCHQFLLFQQTPRFVKRAVKVMMIIFFEHDGYN